MNASSTSIPIVQVAFSAVDSAATLNWYQEVFGFIPSGENLVAGGPEVAAMTGLPDFDADIFWLNDTSDWFQLEFFSFRRPTPKAAPRTPHALGWNLVGIEVADLDAVLERLRGRGAHVGEVIGSAPARRVCTVDPEGAWIELRERDDDGPWRSAAVREVPATVVFARAVVSDLDLFRSFFERALGLEDTGRTLHTAEDERLWGAEPTSSRSSVLTADAAAFGMCIELVEYDSFTPQALGDDYLVSDQWLLNVAFGSRDPERYEQVVRQLEDGRDAAYPARLRTRPWPLLRRAAGPEPGDAHHRRSGRGTGVRIPPRGRAVSVRESLPVHCSRERTRHE